MKLSTKIILPIILISALLILLAGCFGIPDSSPGYTPGSITGRIMVPVDCSDCLTDGPCLPPKGISVDVPSHWVSAEEAIVTVIPHATLTDEDGYYTLTNVEPGVYYVITATYKNLVLKDVVEPDGVEAGKTYEAGTANCESTALGLVVEYLWDLEMDLDSEDIESALEMYKEDPKFTELVETVCCIIENCDNVTLYCDLVDFDEPEFTPELESITVSPNPMVLCLTGTGSPDSGTITTTAYYSDGSSATVTPDSYTPNPSGVVSVSGNVVTPDAGAEDGETTTITVSYEEDGITETATVDVTVTDCTLPTTLLSITVSPNPMVLCLTGTGSPDSGTITTTAYYSDGSSATVTPDSYTPNPSGVVSVSGNVVTPDAGAEDGETTTITVSYEEDGITETATVDVTVTDCTSYYTLTMAVDPTGGGTTNPAVGSHTYPENEVVTLTATPALGYHFVEWTGDASGTNPTASVTMDGGKSVTANFARENIITSINIAGWENASCKPNFDHPHAPAPVKVPGT